MKIQYETGFGKSKEVSVEDALQETGHLDPMGQVEYAAEQAQRARTSLGRLCEVLRKKGLLEAHEILEIAGIYHTGCRFIED